MYPHESPPEALPEASQFFGVDRRPAPKNSKNYWYAYVKLDGGLGNRLFQVAFALGCARRSPPARIAFVGAEERAHHSDRTYAELLGRVLAACEVAPPIEDGHLYYTEDPRETVPRYDPTAQTPPDRGGDPDVHAVLFRGRFQRPEYFEHCRDEIRRLLRPEPEEVRVRLDATTCIPWARTAFLHVRLGDYVDDPAYWDPGRVMAFYERRLAALEPAVTVAVVSNGSPEDVRRHFPGLHACAARLGLAMVDVDERDELVVLYLMARCGMGGIVPNSTFSWWGRFLGPCGDDGGQGGVKGLDDLA